MVHALEKAARCLNSEGVILEVHDLAESPRIEVHSDHGEFFAGQLLSRNYFENERVANHAINQVIAREVLTSNRSVVFEYYIRADSFEEMSNWLAEEWLNEYIPEYTRSIAIDLESQEGEESQAVLRMVSRLNLMIKTNHQTL